MNPSGGVMVSMRYIMGLSPGWVKPKTIKLIFLASSISTQHKGVRTKTVDGLDTGQCVPSGATCLPADCCSVS